MVRQMTLRQNSLLLLLVSTFVITACGGGELDVDDSNNEGEAVDIANNGSNVATNNSTDPVVSPNVDPNIDPNVDPGQDPDVIEPSDVPNQGWIGGACADATACEYENATCLTDYPGGTCSLDCDQFCPDQDGTNSITFCIEKDGAGTCVSRCDYDLYPDAGCREGYACRIRERFNDSSMQQAVCVPETDPTPNATTTCLQELDRRGIIWAPWNYTTQTASNGAQCTIGDPIRVSSPVNGVDYRYYSSDTPSAMSMACELALALDELGDVLKEYEIDTVLHIGTFNCRPISGSNNLSQHSYGLAIDIFGFEDVSNERYILEDHWEHDTTAPQGAKARVLYEIGQAMHDQQIFNIVLTPNFNSAHDNHFHVDLTAGGNFIGVSNELPEYWIGNDRDVCPGH